MVLETGKEKKKLLPVTSGAQKAKEVGITDLKARLSYKVRLCLKNLKKKKEKEKKIGRGLGGGKRRGREGARREFLCSTNTWDQ